MPSADVIILAVPFGVLDDVIATLGSAINGKVLVDVTNAIAPDLGLALGFTTSGAEELQKKAPSTQVVKAFNTVFASHLETGQVKEEQHARLLEPMGFQHIQFGFTLEMGTEIGLKLVH